MVAFDSNIFIYMLNETSEFNKAAKAVLRPVLDGAEAGAVSSILITEVLAGLKKNNTAFLDHPHIQVLPVTAAVATLAGTLCSSHNSLRTVDAVHLATAITAGCTKFVTNDQQLVKLKLPIEIVSLEQYVEAAQIYV